MNKIFKLEEDSKVCVYKWRWSTIFLNRGTTASCHRGRHWDIDENTITDFHNHPGKLSDREKMLNNEWPGNGCEYCRDVEKAGGVSDRVLSFNDAGILHKDVINDPTETRTQPTLVEVYFNNLCNQACIYCNPAFSSVIEQEVRKYGKSQYSYPYSTWEQDARDKYDLYLEKFWEWMNVNAQTILVFQILGGEPMYQKEFDMCLDFFENNPCPDLTWKIFSNMNHDPEKLKVKIQRIKNLIDSKKIKRMEIVASIDCWGEDLEFIRDGLNLNEAEENINLILDTEGIDLMIHATMSVFSLRSMPMLVEKVHEWNKKKFVPFHWNTIASPDFFSVYVFGDKLVRYIDKVIEKFDEFGGVRDYQQTLPGIKQRMLDSKPDIAMINNLVGFMGDLDIRRKRDWAARFPEIAQIANEIKQNG